MSGNISDPLTWAPDESPADLLSERIGLAGIFIGAVAFGVHLTIFCWCINIFYTKKRSRQDWWQLVYICVVFTLSNIGNATYIKYAQDTWIDNRNYPGGPNAYFLEQQSNFDFVLNDGVYIVLTWFQDGLLLYRLWVITGGKWYFVVLPIIMLITSIVFAIYLLIVLTHPGVTFQSNIAILLGIPYWAISIANNVYITIVIASHLLVMRRRVKMFSGLGSGATYLSVTAILVESAALYTVSALAFIIPFALKSPVQNIFLPLLGQTQSIAPVLVILRSLLGRAWTSTTAAELTTHNGRSTVQYTGPSGRSQNSATVAIETFRNDSYTMSPISKKKSDLTIGADV